MAKKDTFDKMYSLYNAIADIDKIVNSPNDVDQNGECKLDQVLFYVKEIPKKEYNVELSNQIISCIRSAIVEMYNKTAQEINNDISAGAPVVAKGSTTPKSSTIPNVNLQVNPARQSFHKFASDNGFGNGK